MEHPHILDRVAEDEDDDNEQIDGISHRATQGQSQGASTQPDSPAETEDASRPSSAMSSVSQRGKKRRRSNSLMVLPQLKGSDFWSMVEKWFAARMQQDQLGMSWTTPGWTKYVSIYITFLLLT